MIPFHNQTFQTKDVRYISHRLLARANVQMQQDCRHTEWRSVIHLFPSGSSIRLQLKEGREPLR